MFARDSVRCTFAERHLGRSLHFVEGFNCRPPFLMYFAERSRPFPTNCIINSHSRGIVKFTYKVNLRFARNTVLRKKEPFLRNRFIFSQDKARRRRCMQIQRAARNAVLRKKKLFRREFCAGKFNIFHEPFAGFGDFLVIACFCAGSQR